MRTSGECGIKPRLVWTEMPSTSNSEARLRDDVEEELGCEPSVNAVAIGVAVEDGMVTLSGHVASHAEKVAAEHAAARVRGVKAIVSELEVKLPDASHSRMKRSRGRRSMHFRGTRWSRQTASKCGSKAG